MSTKPKWHSLIVNSNSAHFIILVIKGNKRKTVYNIFDIYLARTKLT